MTPSDTHVLILVGGLGTRLRSVVQDLPKPMAPIKGKPFLSYLVESLKNQGFRHFTFLTGYKGDVIQKHFGDGSSFGVQISYSLEDVPLGTGGAVAQAMKASKKEHYLILNGDSFFGTNLDLFLKKAKGPITLALRLEKDLARYGHVETDTQNNILSFKEKSSSLTTALINAGIYYFHHSASQFFPMTAQPDQVRFSLEKDVFEPMAKSGILKGITCEGPFLDIGIPEAFLDAQEKIPVWTQQQ